MFKVSNKILIIMALFIFLMLVPVSFAQESQTDSSDDINATILSDSLQTSDISAVEDADEQKVMRKML